MVGVGLGEEEGVGWELVEVAEELDIVGCVVGLVEGLSTVACMVGALEGVGLASGIRLCVMSWVGF